MLHELLDANRAEVIERCRAKGARRPTASAPMGKESVASSFLGQLIETLRIEQFSRGAKNRVVAGPWGPPARDLPSEIASTATRNSANMFRHGFTIGQVVTDYGDLRQSAIELAIERRAPVSAREFHTLSRCLDDAIGDAVTEFSRQRDPVISETGDRATSERLGFLAHELRDLLGTAKLAFETIKGGGLHHATSAALDGNVAGLRDCSDLSLADGRVAAGGPANLDDLALEPFIADVQATAPSSRSRTGAAGFPKERPRRCSIRSSGSARIEAECATDCRPPFARSRKAEARCECGTSRGSDAYSASTCHDVRCRTDRHTGVR